MAQEDNNMDSREFPFKPISARQFLDLFPLSMSKEEKEEMAAEMEQNAKDMQTVSEDEKRFREILESVGREGTEPFIHYLKINGFFTAPGSVVHHSNWKGGLVNHSLKVYDWAMKFREEMIQNDPSLAEELKDENVAVAALLHDICKADEYKMKADGTPAHKEASAHLGGHGYKSVILILFHGFKLTGDEILAIRWHMGAGRIKDPKEKAECEKAKKESALVRLIIKADHEAATHK